MTGHAKMKSIDRIIAKFAIKNIPKIDGKPDYANLNEMIQALYANTATLSTTLGGGSHGHVGLIMKPTLYTTLTATEWENPDEDVLFYRWSENG